MTKEQIEQIVIRVTADQFMEDASKISRETNFRNDLHADSLDNIELLTELEAEFDMAITDDEAEQVIDNGGTVGNVVDFIFDQIGT